ncbi:hypothetical protein K438DRAFT_90877 [Mycena galopus ATCC 62051]|nr:hypothetical protein K438DRAFT_90877 [Mycena galopus ATCC 62051]
MSLLVNILPFLLTIPSQGPCSLSESERAWAEVRLAHTGYTPQSIVEWWDLPYRQRDLVGNHGIFGRRLRLKCDLLGFVSDM